jgi:hypothetical protein
LGGGKVPWNLDDLHEGLSLLGGGLCLLSALSGLHHAAVLLTAWLCYLTHFVAGQTFYGFQWDILLLEVGAVALLYAPWGSGLRATGRREPAAWVLRCVLFKLMLMAGVVKVQANCPSWLQLRALEYHYATQCIPTPLSRWAHQLHPLLQRASVAATLLIEGPATLLLVSPILPHRRLGAGMQVGGMGDGWWLVAPYSKLAH